MSEAEMSIGGGGSEWSDQRISKEIRTRVWLSQLAEFAPTAVQDSLSTALTNACLKAGVNADSLSSTSSSTSTLSPQSDSVGRTSTDIDGSFVRIGSSRFPLPSQPSSHPELIPQPLFFDVPDHVMHMESMAPTILNGSSPLLLIGDQGTGKNKITDRLLQLLQREREYMQLHRDSTVQSLTVVPTLTKGALEWVDSPLVTAIKYGRVIVIDEADKAPTETVVVLKGLVEDGLMQLSDGRKIVRTADGGMVDGSNDIVVHPDFRMIVLANRPGFPFLGNDFFVSCCCCCCCCCCFCWRLRQGHV